VVLINFLLHVLQYDTVVSNRCVLWQIFSVFVSFWALAPLLVCFAVSWRNQIWLGIWVVLVVALFDVSVNDCVYVLTF
jgi:hypothetical protein